MRLNSEFGRITYSSYPDHFLRTYPVLSYALLASGLAASGIAGYLKHGKAGVIPALSYGVATEAIGLYLAHRHSEESWLKYGR